MKTRPALLAALGLGLLGQSLTLAQESEPQGATTISQVLGRVEVQSSAAVWRSLTAPAPLEAGLRTGTGRATLGNPAGGRITVGSASVLRMYSQETDFQQGAFLLDGPVAAFALGSHLFADRPGRVRVDLTPDGSTRRLAVIRGAIRVSSGKSAFNITEGQQLDLNTLKISPFKETDPWYASQFTGVGSATVEALRGVVQVRGADGAAHNIAIGTDLAPGDILTTGAQSWAEVGFSGGGYLRLTENSELRVLAVEKTTKGREVTLQLTKGSAWNVVEKGQGGYKISTPVVSTAVRGTKYRVDANGTVKVVEGEVALPSEGDGVVQAGQQKLDGQAVGALVEDDLDRLNQQLDAQHDLPMTLTVDLPARQQSVLQLGAETLPDTRLKATATGAGGQAIALQVNGDTSVGKYSVTGPDLPEGRYQVLVQARRFRQQLWWSSTIRIDRTPPVLSHLSLKRKGQVVTLTGRATDNSGQPLSLTITGLNGVGAGLNGAGQTGNSVQANNGVQAHNSVLRFVQGDFTILLPATVFGNGAVNLTLKDGAGHESQATLP